MEQRPLAHARARPRASRARLAGLLVVGLALCPPPALAQRSAAERADERTLFRLENQWARAVVKRDAAAIGRLVAPRWVYSDETGVMNRAQGIKSFTSGPDTVREASNSEMRAIVYPQAAVVIGILKMTGSGPNGPFTHRYRYTDTWARLDGRWRCIASQDYLMPAERAAR